MAAFQVQMPEVEPLPAEKLAKVFVEARKFCEGKRTMFGFGPPERNISLITPGRLTAIIPCPAPNSMSKDMVKSTERILPPKPPKYVVAIAYTELEVLMGRSGTMDPAHLSRVIPFLGFLLGFSYIGHSVVIFEGHSSALPIGLKGADMVLIDERMAPHLRKDFLDVAYKVMRNPLVNLYQMDGQVRQIGKKK